MIVIAIDGPAGSGKSSVSKECANRLGFGYLDTGAAYRALTWAVMTHRISLENKEFERESLDLLDSNIDADFIVNNYSISFSLKFDPFLSKYDNFSKKSCPVCTLDIKKVKMIYLSGLEDDPNFSTNT